MNAFIFPSSIFGGHEMMASKIVKQLSIKSSSGVLVVVNRSIFKQVKACCGDRCQYKVCFFPQTYFENILGLFNPIIYVKMCLYLFLVKKLKRVTIVNGGLSANHSTTLALLIACKVSDVLSSVYYPMFHSPTEVGLSGVKARSYINAVRRIVSLSDSFITIDETWARRLKDTVAVNKKPIKIIHNYIDCSSEVNENQRLVPKGDDNRFNLTFIGRLDKYQKGLDFLADIMSLVSERSNNYKYNLNIIGDGPYKVELVEALSDVCDRYSNFSFHVYGWVDNASALMPGFDLIIMPSRLEGIPTVMIEAIKNKINIVAFNIDGVNNVLCDESLVDCFDRSAMADRIIEMCMGNAKTTYDQTYVDVLFNPERFQKEIISIFN